MNFTTQSIKFKYSWRDYQQRVLSELETHLEDEHLNVVAPPGSGKTVLGLEVMLRINKSTLILAPTSSIRNQWKDRFVELFLNNQDVDWISMDIHQPKFLTISTYQGLHASMVKDEQSLLQLLKENNVKTLIVDEAHHLKNEWWKSLNKIKNELLPKVVALTATPPFDVAKEEWNRYLTFCGPIDCEISVPELVKQKDLCPHQDLLLCSFPTNFENEIISKNLEEVEVFFQEVKQNTALYDFILKLDFIKTPASCFDEIYADFDMYASFVIYLKLFDTPLDFQHLDLLENETIDFPPFNYYWAECMFNYLLFKDEKFYLEHEKFLKPFLIHLKRIGAIDQKKVTLHYNQKIKNSLINSVKKIDSIANIVISEFQHLGDKLHMVILTDYIRKEFYSDNLQNEPSKIKLGVFPIFEKLRNLTSEITPHLAIITGSMVVVSKTILSKIIYQFKDKAETIQFKTVMFDDNFFEVVAQDNSRGNLLAVLTKLFNEGFIKIIVGTRAYLGEGWDAPSINSLVLASNVGSFVTSNQMRGRAIRVNSDEPNKVSNVWHLVTLDLQTQNGGADLDKIKQRFEAFVGISQKENIISNGISRLNLPDELTIQSIENYNQQTIEWSKNDIQIRDSWTNSIAEGTKIDNELKYFYDGEKEYDFSKHLYYSKSIKNVTTSLLLSLTSFIVFFFEESIRTLLFSMSKRSFFSTLFFLSTVGIVYFSVNFYKNIKLYLQYRDITKDFDKIAVALFKTLQHFNLLSAELRESNILTTVDKSGNISCSLLSATTYDKAIFLDSLENILNPIDNPRYFIERKSELMKLFKQRDYHSVPEIIGQHKKKAEYFHEQWLQIVGEAELHYTRSYYGRKKLIKAKIKSLSFQLKQPIEHIKKWK
ncbi:DEAD/DEAH box helicase family protein [Empedobacter tilapiae]|uniref:DEAD/DEAH box helicase n=1 Tax=Empedobacter tilapiae TaxID=2491114 RepID=A0A4Z1B1Q3_9FLAO|nr:DEAD/DEAH box helicase family protein [Empedobacter tilapiae]TGN27233.1 DEAD/DEAH box helicase [Empedobacter tilapiae]